MGKLANWLTTTAKAASGGRPTYQPARLSRFDAERMAGFRYALDSRGLGQPTQDYLALAGHMTGLVHISVNLLATMVGDSKWSLWEYRDGDRPVRLTRDDPIHQLYENPNEIDTAEDFWYDHALHYELTGMSLIWCPPDRDPSDPNAQIAEMYVMPRAGMILAPPTPEFPQGYWTALPYGMYGNPAYGMYTAGTRIPAEQVVVFKKRHPYFRWEGYSVLSAMSQSISTLEGLETSRLSAMLQGCDQSVVVKYDKDVTQPPREVQEGIEAQWYAKYGGPNNAGKLLFLGGGADIERFSATPAEMAYAEGFGQMVDYLLSAFGTPKALVGMVDELTHSTLFGTLKANHLTKLRPLLNRLSSRHTKDVLRPYYSPSVFLKLEADAIHDDELLERQLDNDGKWGVRTVGEIRQLRGLDLTGAEWEGERAFSGKDAPGGKAGDGKPRDGESGERLDPDDVRDGDSEAARSENVAGVGSLGPRLKSSPDRAEGMLAAMERHLSRGVVRPLEGKNGKTVHYMGGDR